MYETTTERVGLAVFHGFVFLFFQPVSLIILQSLDVRRWVRVGLVAFGILLAITWPAFVGWFFVYQLEFYGQDFSTHPFMVWVIGMFFSFGVGTMGGLLLTTVLHAITHPR